MRFTKLRYFCSIVGVILYVVDIGSDIWVAVQFYQDGHYAWFVLTLLLVLSGSVSTQIFSYAWFRDDIEQGDLACGMTKTQLVFLHVLQLGTFTRYYQLLKKGITVIQTKHSLVSQDRALDLQLFGMATDLSMLKLFRSFLESTPQLLLQVYIILGHNHRSIIQYICITGSFLSIAWATVDYRRCFRRSLPHLREMPSGLPTAVYLLYKLFTIASRVLSLSLLVAWNVYCVSALAFIWLLGTVWTHTLQTDFCTSEYLEEFYRGIIGVILIFTFFNVKGQNTRVPMVIYYTLYVLQNLSVPVMVFFLKSADETSSYFWPVTSVIAGSLLAGLMCLSVFYAFMHPRGETREVDEVDGLGEESENSRRRKMFLQH
ncbi:hypothetical protein MATL_G00035630 [Megalops atlanticus]|uniref:XK-related protein n=1 Tax=Megalops atlanticus TaxID=7932 RepID=A0A9D3QH76_MEGAT|nr:hypothetical protein MATL_G00035630 [Megalops atlanticus]